MSPHRVIRIAPASATVAELVPPTDYERIAGGPVESVTFVNVSPRADLVVKYEHGRVILHPGMACRFEVERIDGGKRWRAGLVRNAMVN